MIGVPSGHIAGTSPLACAAPVSHVAQTSEKIFVFRLPGSHGVPAFTCRVPQELRSSLAGIFGQRNPMMGP